MHEVLYLTQRELRSAFRESSVVLYSVLLPLLLYPFLLWLMVSVMTFVQGQEETRIYRIGYQQSLSQGPLAPFIERLAKSERVILEPTQANSLSGTDYQALLQPQSEGPIDLVYVGDRPESVEAKGFLEREFQEYSRESTVRWLEKEGRSPEVSRPFLLLATSTSVETDVGGYLLGALIPIGLLVMIALGGAYPAIDSTAGERERGTWETLQSCGPSMTSVLASKYLFVSIVCSLSGTLNLFAMLVSIRSIVAPMLRGDESITFQVSPQTLLVLLLGVVGVSLFVAAALLLCAIFARTFREGQALVTPMFMLLALPVLPLSDPSLEINAKIALIPLVNLALIWRQALQGRFHPLYISETLLVLGVLVAFSLWFGSRLLQNETLMMGAGPEMNGRRIWQVVRGVFRGR